MGLREGVPDRCISSCSKVWLFEGFFPLVCLSFSAFFLHVFRPTVFFPLFETPNLSSVLLPGVLFHVCVFVLCSSKSLDFFMLCISIHVVCFGLSLGRLPLVLDVPLVVIVFSFYFYAVICFDVIFVFVR